LQRTPSRQNRDCRGRLTHAEGPPVSSHDFRRIALALELAVGQQTSAVALLLDAAHAVGHEHDPGALLAQLVKDPGSQDAPLTAR
jgi:hypothetical protein